MQGIQTSTTGRVFIVAPNGTCFLTFPLMLDLTQLRRLCVAAIV